MDEEHFRLSTQAWAVKVIKILHDVKNANWFGITGVQHSKLAMGEEATGECIEAGMINTGCSQQQPLQGFHRQIVMNLDIKLEILKQLLQSLCQVTDTTSHVQQVQEHSLTFRIQLDSGPPLQWSAIQTLTLTLE